MRSQEELDRLYQALDTVYFLGESQAKGVKVVWKTYRPLKRHFVYGHFMQEELKITINKVLAKPEVPDYVLMGTVFHELCHLHVGCDHDAGFNAAESRYVHHAACQLWESENHRYLLNARVSGKNEG